MRSSEAPSGKLHADEQVALVLDRQEAGRHPREAADRDADDDASAISTIRPLRADHAADQPRIAALDAVVDAR